MLVRVLTAHPAVTVQQARHAESVRNVIARKGKLGRADRTSSNHIRYNRQTQNSKSRGSKTLAAFFVHTIQPRQQTSVRNPQQAKTGQPVTQSANE